MATLLDFGFFEFMLPVFVFFLIFILLFAFLQKTKFLGGNRNIDLLISIVIALVTMFSGNAVELVQVLTPWYVVMFIVVIFLLFMMMAFGVKEGDALEIVTGGQKGVLIFVLGIIFLMVAISNVFGPVFFESFTQERTGSEVISTIFNPRLLGAFLILLIVGLVIGVLHKET